MEITTIKNTNKHLEIGLLFDICQFSHLSFRLNRDKKGNKSIYNIKIYSLTSIEESLVTNFSFAVYLSAKIFTKMISFLEKTELSQCRPERDYWHDYSYNTESLEGDPNALYFEIGDFDELFGGCFCQHCEVASIVENVIIIFHDRDRYEVNSNSEVPVFLVVCSENEILFYLNNSIPKNEKNNSSKLRNTSDDWMDDPENYWNVD